MEILLWLAPAAVVTVVAMLWVGWAGSTRRAARTLDRDEAARRIGEALGRERGRPGYAAPRRPAEPSTGVAVRRTRPVVVDPPAEPAEGPTEEPGADRRAS